MSNELKTALVAAAVMLAVVYAYNKMNRPLDTLLG
jgi:hypothetical protein